MIDAKSFGKELAAIVRAQLAPLSARLDEIERRLKDAPAGAIPDAAAIAAQVRLDIDPTIRDLARCVEALVIPELPDIPGMIADAIAALPKPEAPDTDIAPIVEMRFTAIADQLKADQAQFEAELKASMQATIAALPKPKDGEPGKSVTLSDVFPLVDEAVGKAISAIPPAKDGIGLAGALLSRGGNLILTLTNGTTCDLGAVVGRDADMSALLASIDEKFAALPKPRDGADGLGFEDLDLEIRDDGVYLCFARADQRKEFRLPIVTDCGVFADGRKYSKGAGVTWAGSFWIAQKETAEKPGVNDDWRLATKRGRDGKNPAPEDLEKFITRIVEKAVAEAMKKAQK